LSVNPRYGRLDRPVASALSTDYDSTAVSRSFHMVY